MENRRWQMQLGRDHHLLLEYGDPKSTRFYPGGHMGGGNSQAVIVQWLKERLSA